MVPLPDAFRTLAEDEQDVYLMAYNSAVAEGAGAEAEARAASAVGALRVLRAGGQAIVLKYDLAKHTPGGHEHDQQRHGRASALREAEGDRSRWPEHIRALAVPPAWTDVLYSADPTADLLVVGRDAKGRVQSVYSEAFSARQAAAKFARVSELDEKFERVRREVDKDAKSADEREAALAQAAQLVMATGIRPGSDKETGADKQAYGATTLEGRHVKTAGRSTTLEFVGKKGVPLNIPVEDKAVARMVRARAREAGKTGRLFPGVSQASLGRYVSKLDGGGFKTKDLRTALGTRAARAAVAKMSAPTSAAEYKRAVRAVATQVAQRLGNTPTVALQSYIDPTVFAPWRAHAIPPTSRRRK